MKAMGGSPGELSEELVTGTLYVKCGVILRDNLYLLIKYNVLYYLSLV